MSEARRLLAERLESIDPDGPRAYAPFLAEPGNDDDAATRLRQEAAAVIKRFLSYLVLL